MSTITTKMEPITKALKAMRAKEGITPTDHFVMKTLFCGISKARQLCRGDYPYAISEIERRTMISALTAKGYMK